MDNNYMQLYSRLFWPHNIKQNDISILDIAHSLSQQCRYTGHTKKFYSVAEHSLIVSDYLPHPFKLWGLMHDAAEAYMCDLASPIKHSLPKFKAMENKIMDVIAIKYGLAPYPMPVEVKKIDNAILNDEKEQTMRYPDLYQWGSITEPPLRCTINFYPPAEAKLLFLERFLELSFI